MIIPTIDLKTCRHLLLLVCILHENTIMKKNIFTDLQVLLSVTR